MLIVASCASTGAAHAGRVHNATAPASSSPSSIATAIRRTRSFIKRRTITRSTHQRSAQPGWLPVSVDQSGVVIDQRTVAVSGGRSVVVTRFRAGAVDFRLHVGTSDPPNGYAIVDRSSGPVVSAVERSRLFGAFNGGFKQSSGAGGFEVDQRVLRPLIPGRASFVIDSDGSAHVGVWGYGLPAPHERVVSVRQNLTPLVIDSRPSPYLIDIGAWGSTLRGWSVVARSAVGQDAAGNILYAASMQALPSDLADALIASGATFAMELDINPQWVQLDLAGTAGGPLRAAIWGQHRPADQYLVGWTRDFVTVLTRPSA